MNNEEKINLLAQKLIVLQQELDRHQNEIKLLRNEIEKLSNTTIIEKSEDKINPVISSNEPKDDLNLEPELLKEEAIAETSFTDDISQPNVISKIAPEPKEKFNLEAFLGGKIVHIIGTIVLVIGIFIGVKYAIEKDLIDELTRTVLGYIAGIILLGFAFRLKRNYAVFSSVILSGGVAVMFFSTYIGHSFYHLFPNALIPFGIMVALTVFIVFAAHIFNYEVIAVIGLLGSYAIPILLSDGSGHIEIMFTYMAIINAGILVTSILKNWKWVRYSAYFLTWIIYSIWYGSSYSYLKYFEPAFWFAFCTYITFSLSGVLYKIRKSEYFNVGDIILMLGNNFIFFGFAYATLNDKFHAHLLGALCLLVAAINGVLAFVAGYKNQERRSVFLILITLCISFATLAVPVQLNGHWVTSIWFIEALVLFGIGQLFKLNYYRILAFASSILGFFSLCHDWSENSYYTYSENIHLLSPFFNTEFLSGLIGSIGLLIILLITHRYKTEEKTKLIIFLNWAFPVIFIFVSYFTFHNEIGNYFNYKLETTSVRPTINDNGGSAVYYNYSLNDWESIFKLIYLALYFTVFVAVSRKTDHNNPVMPWIRFSVIILSLLLLYEQGLYAADNLREYYFNSFGDNEQNVFRNDSQLYARYFIYPCIALLQLLLFTEIKRINNAIVYKIFPWINHVGILFLLSFELTQLMMLNHIDEYERYERISYRMGYTILWSLYSMTLIVYGFWKRRKTERMVAFAIFGITLLKLITNAFSMSRGYQLIVFISVGIILIVVGFLYQRYKDVILSNDE